MEQDEQDDVLVVGWLRGDDYEAALAYRQADRAQRDSPDSPSPLRRLTPTPIDSDLP